MRILYCGSNQCRYATISVPRYPNDPRGRVFFGQLPATILQHFVDVLPAEFVAEPRVHLGSLLPRNGEVDSSDQYSYELLVFDQEHDRRLVAAVELVSPANKDRLQTRRAFVSKCAALLAAEGRPRHCGLGDERANSTSMLNCSMDRDTRPWIGDGRCLLSMRCDANSKTIGPKRFGNLVCIPWSWDQPLPTLPLWLASDFAVPIDLKQATRTPAAPLAHPLTNS